MNDGKLVDLLYEALCCAAYDRLKAQGMAPVTRGDAEHLADLYFTQQAAKAAQLQGAT